MKYVNSRVGAVVAGATVIGLLSAGAAFAHGYGESIGGEDIRNESIYSQDIANGQVKMGELNQAVIDHINTAVKGEKGDQGEPGATGATGADGDDGVAGYEADGFYRQLDGSTGVQKIYAECADGKVAVGGGFSPEDGFTHEGVTVIASRPSVAEGHFEVIEGDPEGSVRSMAWELWFVNESGDPRNVRPWVVCAEVD